MTSIVNKVYMGTRHMRLISIASVVTILSLTTVIPVTAAQKFYSLDTVKIGDRVSGFRVSALGTITKKTKRNPDNATTTFKGRVKLTGTVTRYAEDAGFLGGSVCMENLDASSVKRLPREKNDGRKTWFCFDNPKLAKKLLGKKSQIRATATISSYTDVHFGGEAWNQAHLVSLVPEKKKKNVTSGIVGKVSAVEGNCMPMIGEENSSCKESTSIRTIGAFEPVMDSEMEATILASNKKPVVTAQTKQDGSFRLPLKAGTYSVLVDDDGRWYCNSFGGQKNQVCPVMIGEKMEKMDIRIDHAVW